MKLYNTIAVLVFVFAASGFAQKNWNTNWAIGPHISMSFPQSEFADISRNGEGLGAKVFYRVDALPYFLPRFDVTYLSFGEKRTSIYQYDPYSYIETRNESFQFLLGPQFATKLGRFSLYLAPMGGLFTFRTIETIPYSYDYYYYDYGQPLSDTKSSLTRWGWALNTGFLFDLGLGPHIDFELKYQKIANAVSHTVEGQKVKSDATDFGVSVGVVFFIRETRKRRY